MAIPDAVQVALDKLVSDYGVLRDDVTNQTTKYNDLALAQAGATAADQAVSNDHGVVAEDLAALKKAIDDAFPN